jgi:hypothetical protein
MTAKASTKSTLPASLQAVAFPLFPVLPTELRIKIWLLTLPPPRTVEISYYPAYKTYISTTPPPLALSICHLSRQVAQSHYHDLDLGTAPLPIPFSFLSETLYISSLAPILSTHGPNLLYDLSVFPWRHALRSLGVDLRVWYALCESGLLGVLAGMTGLREVALVVEFGRAFSGEVGFVEAPEWRGDLTWVAKRAAVMVEEARKRLGRCGNGSGKGKEEIWRAGAVKVSCVFLMRGGDQA